MVLSQQHHQQSCGDNEKAIMASAATVMPVCSGGGVDADYGRHGLEEKKTDPPTPINENDNNSHSSGPSQYRPNGGVEKNEAHHLVHSYPQHRSSYPNHPPPTKSWTNHHNHNGVPTNTTPRTPRLSFQRSPSLDRTKSWTEQRAPEPFSSPAPIKNKLNTPKPKKYGYGNLFRSASSGVAHSGHNSGLRNTPRSSFHGGRNNFHVNPGKQQQHNSHVMHRSLSSGVPSSGGNSGLRSAPRSFHGGRNTFHNGNNVPGNKQLHHGHVMQRGYSVGSRMAPIERQPSFTKSDFPLLSPKKPKHQQHQRKASWSAVVGARNKHLIKDMTASATADSSSYDIADGIPPLPLLDMPIKSLQENTEEKIWADKDVESESGEEGTVATEETDSSSHVVQSSLTYWQQSAQRQRAHSFHQYSSDHNKKQHLASHQSNTPDNNILYHPFSTFTTMSISALQNDIGTVLARSNRVDEAIKRYKSSIESAEVVLLDLQMKNENDGDANISSEDEDGNHEMRSFGKKCPKVTEAEGLAWFRQKLLRGDMIPAPIPTSISDPQVGDPLESLAPDPSHGNHFISSLLPQPPPFQPAGFGGLCAPKSPRRLRSASFSVTDLCPAPPPKHLAMPSMPHLEQTQSMDHQAAPRSPIRPLTRPARMTSCPVTAPHPGKPIISIKQPRTPQLSRAQSSLCAGERRSLLFHRHTHSGQQVIAPLDDIVHDIHQHQKLDCPDNEVYSCNGLTQLGLEYVCDPLPILGCALRSLIMSSGTDIRRKRMNMEMMEMAALVASRLNLASLEYRLAGGGVSDNLQQVLKILELALEDCHDASKVAENLASSSSSSWDNGDCNIKARKRNKFSTLFCLLKAVVHSNIGAVKYRLNKVRDSMASFEAAKSALENNDTDETNTEQHNQMDFDLNATTARDEYCNHHVQSEPHDDNRFPPRSYLLLVIRLNLSRVSLRLNKSNEASKLCHLISEDNKPHRRNSSRRSLQGHAAYHGFRRSNSFSAASSALETAIATYEHDIDRRSKWLCSVSEHYITGLIYESNGESTDYKEAWHHYNRLLSTARVKLDHRHPYICALLERRGAVLFEQRKLQCSMLSYLACLKILEHQQSTGSTVFNEADLSRVLYAVARVLHDNEEYHDAIHMYQRTLVCQRTLAAVSGRPSLDVITTLCNISRVHHLSGEIDEALTTNREVLDLATILVGGKMEHPFLIHRLKVEGNILVEAGRLEDAMRTFVEAARRCSEDGRDRMMTELMGDGSAGGGGSSQEDADAGDSSVLSIRSAAALAQINFFHPAAAAA